MEYAKWVIVLPPKKVKEARLNDGDELDVEVKKNGILIKKKS